MWLATEPSVDSCFLVENHMSIFSLVPSSDSVMSTGQCLKLRTSEPRGPVTVTMRAATTIFTVHTQHRGVTQGLAGAAGRGTAAEGYRRRRSGRGRLDGKRAAACNRQALRSGAGASAGRSPPAASAFDRSRVWLFLMVFIAAARASLLCGGKREQATQTPPGMRRPNQICGSDS